MTQRHRPWIVIEDGIPIYPTLGVDRLSSIKSWVQLRGRGGGVQVDWVTEECSGRVKCVKIYMEINVGD